MQTLKEQNEIVLIVKDNGLGKSKRNQEHLFTMFERFHSHVEGAGRLVIAKRMIDNGGASIKVKSEEGVGTEFKVFLR